MYSLAGKVVKIYNHMYKQCERARGFWDWMGPVRWYKVSSECFFGMFGVVCPLDIPDPGLGSPQSSINTWNADFESWPDIPLAKQKKKRKKKPILLDLHQTPLRIIRVGTTHVQMQHKCKCTWDLAEFVHADTEQKANRIPPDVVHETEVAVNAFVAQVQVTIVRCSKTEIL